MDEIGFRYFTNLALSDDPVGLPAFAISIDWQRSEDYTTQTFSSFSGDILLEIEYIGEPPIAETVWSRARTAVAEGRIKITV